MKKIRVAIYHATLPRSSGKKGGVEASVHRIANSLAERGVVEVTVLSSGSKPAGAKYDHRSILNTTNSLRLPRLFISPILFNFVDLSDYDVIHYYGDDWFHFPRNIVSVRTFQGSAKYEAKAATRWPRRILMSVVYVLERISAKKADFRIGSDSATANLYKCQTIVGNGVDGRIYKPAAKSPDMTISFVGTWGGRKRGEFLFSKFVEDILAVYPDARLKMISDHCDAHPSVDHITNASDEDLADILARSWVFAYPSTYEGFGIPYIEAMSCGTAVVASGNTGASNILGDGWFGIIASDDEFSSELLDLLGNERRRQDFEMKGIERSKVFSSEQIAVEHETIYASLMSAPRTADR